MHVLVPDHAERSALEPLPEGMELAVIGDGSPPEDTEIVVGDSRDGLADLVGELPRLRLVQSLAAGVDWLLPSVPEGVTVCDAAGVHDLPVAEWCMGAILAGLKRFAECRDGQVAGDQGRPGPIEDLVDQRVLILGHGSIGRALAVRLEPFGCTVTGVARHARDGVAGVDELPALVGEADVLVVLMPLTPETERMVDAELLGGLPDGALVVNAGRGRLIDQDALLAELEAGRLRAALDVTDPEPLGADHPLRAAPGTLITPHIAGDSPRFLERAYELVADQLHRYARDDELRNVVADGY